MQPVTLMWTSFFLLTSLHHFSLGSVGNSRHGKWDVVAVSSPDSYVSGKLETLS